MIVGVSRGSHESDGRESGDSRCPGVPVWAVGGWRVGGVLSVYDGSQTGRINAGLGERVTEEALDRNASLVWWVTGLLRGVCRQADYQKVGLLLVVLRRLDCVLEPPNGVVLGRCVKLKDRVDDLGLVLLTVAGEKLYDTSPLAVTRPLAVPL